MPSAQTLTFGLSTPLVRANGTRSSQLPNTQPRRRARAHFAMSTRVLVPIGNGSEDIETATIVDTLRRAGADVTLASVERTERVTMARGMVVHADATVDGLDAAAFDAIALPGGMPGAQRLADCDALTTRIVAAVRDGRVVAALCASPAVVLSGLGVLDGVEATCYPAEGFRGRIAKLGKGDVVVSEGAGGGKIVTGTGPGTALPWSLKVVEVLFSEELAKKLASEMLVEAY